MLCVFLFCSSFVISQSQIQETDGYLWFDRAVDAKRTNLFNGVIEVEKYRMNNGKHKFFMNRSFHLSTLYYEGQPYHLVKLKYDLYEDVVLVNGRKTLRLENDKINKFIIGKITFVKLNTYGNNDQSLHGFFEVLNDYGQLKLYKKHRKDKLDRLGDRWVYHDFIDDNSYYVMYDHVYYRVEKKKDIIDIFPKYKRQLNTHSKKSSGRMEQEDYLLFLLEHVNRLVSTEQTLELK